MELVNELMCKLANYFYNMLIINVIRCKTEKLETENFKS